MPSRKSIQPGTRFGRLIVTGPGESYISPHGVKHPRVRCICDCGTSIEVSEYVLRKRGTRSCGCYKADQIRIAARKRLVDLTGRKFGRLTVIELLRVHPRYGGVWNCVCACGNRSVVTSGNLKKKSGTRSCGCLKTERAILAAKARVGPAHPNWRADLTLENRQRAKYRSVEPGYLAARFCVVYRDGNKCQSCGKHQAKGLHVHHIKPWDSFPAHRKTNWNMVTLCPRCHRKFHALWGHRNIHLKFIPWLREQRKRLKKQHHHPYG